MLGSIKAALASIATSIKSSLPTVVAATTATVLTGGCIYYYTVKDGGYERNNANVRYVIEEYMNQITLDSIKPNGHDGYAYSTNFNEMVDEIIKKLDEADSVLGSYTGEEKKKEVVEKLIRAELLTQYPDLRSASEIARNKKVRDNELQGGIKIIKRDSTKDTSEATPDEISQYDISDSQVLTYIPYNDFKDKLSNADGSITNYYSLKPSSVSSSLTADFVVKTDAENAAPILNRNQVIQVIQTHYTGNARTNLLNQLNKIMSIQENSKINAVFLMAVAEDMSSCGTIWVKYTSDSYNWLGVKDASYTSLEDATSKFEELISGSEYFGASKYNVSDIASTYNSAAWGNNINEKMAQIYNSIGIDIEESDNVTNTTQTDTSNSIDLVVATSTSENTTVTTVDYMPKEDGTGDEKTENTDDKGTTYTYKEVSINYQNMLSKYSMPAGFLWSLMVMGENVDFVLNLANLVIDDTVIIIEAQDSVSVTVNEQVTRYRNTKTVTRKITTEAKPEEEITDGPIPRFTDPINTPDSSITTTVTTTQSNTRLNLTYAKTWVATYKNRYKNNVNADAQIDENWVETAEWTNINPPAPGQPETRVSEDPNNDSEYEYMKQRIKDNITWDECIGMVNEEISILTIYDSLYYLFKKDNNSELSNLCADYMYYYIKGYYTTSQETDIDKKINDFWKSRTSEEKQFFDDNSIDKQELRRRLYNLIETRATTVITIKTASTTVVTSKTNLKTASNVQTINKNTYTSAGTEVQERTEIDKDKNFVTYFNKSGRAKEYILQSPEWLYEMLESHPKTANMIDLFKYLLYKATDIDLGVTTFDFSIVNTNNFSNFMYGTVPVNGTTLTKEEFIECIKNYSTDSGYQTRFGQYAEKIYDICTSKNINPVLCAAQAGCESGFGAAVPSNSQWNYWGLAVYNDSSVGKEFNSIDEAITYYCDIILGYQKPGSIAYDRANLYAPYHDKITGQMNTIYDIYSAYMYLGDYHSGRMWDGVNVKKYLVEYMKFDCNHKESDPTTMEERAGYIVSYLDNHLITMAKEIFGHKIYNGGGSTINDVSGAGYRRTVNIGDKEYKVYNQGDYGYVNGISIAQAGCSISCEAIITSGYRPELNYTPEVIATKVGFFPRSIAQIASDLTSFGINSTAKVHYSAHNNTAIQNQAIQDISNNLSQGKPVVVLVRTGPDCKYTSGAHYITLVGYTEEGKTLVADPNGGICWTDDTVENIVRTYIYSFAYSEQGYVLINQ